MNMGKWTFISFVCLAVVLPVQAGYFPLIDGSSPGDRVTWVISEDENGISLELRFPGLTVDRIDRDEGLFDRIRVAGCGLTGDEGSPDLPFKGMFLEVPAGVGLMLETESFNEKLIPGRYTVIPRQPPQSDCAGNEPEFTMDPKVYSDDKWVPGAIARIARDGFIRGRRVVFLEIHPVHTSPSEGLLKGYSQIGLRLQYSEIPDTRASERTSRLLSPAFERQAEALIANHHPAQGAGNGESSRDGADYLIITHDDFVLNLMPLADWKLLKGYRTRLVTLTELGGSTATHIKNYLQTAYDTWNPAPTYVLLVGDSNKLPSNTVSPDAYGSPFPSDLPYSMLEGSDYFPDIFLGRISVQTQQQCDVVVNKILEYDRNPEVDNWYNTALIAAYFQDDYSPYCEADRWFFETGTYVMQYLASAQQMSIVTAMCTSASGCSVYHFRSDSYPHRPSHPDPVPQEWIDLITSSSQATSNLINGINAGVGLVQHRDHGEETGWNDPPFFTSHVNSLTNGSRTPVVFSINCLTGAFDYGSDCFAEALQKKDGGGAVGVVAATRVSYSGYNDLLCHGTYTGFFPDYDATHSGNIYADSKRVCEALSFGKYYMYMYEGEGSSTLYTFRLFHWFGDPEMEIRTDTPLAPGIDLPQTIPAGSVQVILPISDEGARVAVTQDGNLLGVGISATGQVVIDLDPPVQGGLPVTVVVTGYNIDPLETDILTGAPSCGIILLDRAGYNCDSDVHVTVMDSDLNTNPGVTEQLVIVVDSSSYPAGIDVTCTETEADNGIFEGVFHTYSFGGSGDLLVAHGDQITAYYHDDDCEGAPADVQKSAGVDCQPPVISNVRVVDVGVDSAVIAWDTSENSESILVYGYSIPPDMTATETGYRTAHEMTLEGLSECMVVYLEVQASDEHGNVGIDNNGGSYYQFTTLQHFVMLSAGMDSDPGWTAEPDWAWGHPTGQGGEHGSPDPAAGYTGLNVCGYNLAGDYPNNMSITRYLTTGSFDCGPAEEVLLGFWCWLGVEQNQYDKAMIDISVDGGSTWQNIWTNAETLDGGFWQYWQFDLTAAAAGQSNVRLRWGMGPTDVGWQYCGWNLDDVTVEGAAECGAPTPPPTATVNPATYTPVPTNTQLPTYTPHSTPVPPTHTPAPPTHTPVPPTHTPVPPTATPAYETGMVLILEDTDLIAGDEFYLHMFLSNRETQPLYLDAYILLDVYGNFWCWPSWRSLNTGLDGSSFILNPLSTSHEAVLRFVWPGNVGNADGLYFYGVACHAGSFDIVGPVNAISWRYR
ncbi:hypothetical protein JXA40_01885 [bacterium]|nr:hypothetical protein [candidate division CSSED10-310 bacterium]